MANKHSGTNYFTKKNGTTVEVRNNNIDKAIRLFRNRCNREGLAKDMRRKEYYEKPTEQRKRKMAEAKKRWRKKQAEMQQDF